FTQDGKLDMNNKACCEFIKLIEKTKQPVEKYLQPEDFYKWKIRTMDLKKLVWAGQNLDLGDEYTKNFAEILKKSGINAEEVLKTIRLQIKPIDPMIKEKLTNFDKSTLVVKDDGKLDMTVEANKQFAKLIENCGLKLEEVFKPEYFQL